MADLDRTPSGGVASSPLVFGLLLVPLLVVATIALIVGNHLTVDGYMTDDAFISFRYSRNLADGIGPVWQPGSHVEGYTNFGWVLIIAATTKLGVNPVDASRILGLMASLMTIALVPVAAAQLRPIRSGGWWVITGGTCAALLVNTAFSLWAFAGLETPLFTCLVLAALTAHWYEERSEVKRPALSAFILLLAALTRPDGVVVWAVIAAWKVVAALRRDLWPAGLLGWAACFLVPFLVYWCWRWSYYGDFFPNTYYLKAGSGRAFYERGARYLRDFFVVYWIWLAGLAFVSMLQERGSRNRPVVCGVSLLVAWSAYIVAGGGDWMPYFRFFVPILPVAYLLTMNGAVSLAELVGHRVPSVAKAVGLAGFVGLLVFSSVRPAGSGRAKDPSGFQTNPLPGAIDLESHREIGLWMKENIPAEFTVAQIATGVIPYYSELPTLDMFGVNDRYIAHLDVPVGNRQAGHDKQDGAYVLLSKPEVIWLSIGREADPRRTPADYKPPIDERLAPVITDVTRNAYLWLFYRPVAIQLSTGWLNLIVRNDVTTLSLTPND